jgi:hypothetical protein
MLTLEGEEALENAGRPQMDPVVAVAGHKTNVFKNLQEDVLFSVLKQGGPRVLGLLKSTSRELASHCSSQEPR